MATAHHEKNSKEESLPASEDYVKDTDHADPPLTFSALTAISTDIKSSLSAAINDLKAGLLVMSESLAATEHQGRWRDKAISRLEDITVLYAMNKHLKDIDNRGRRRTF